MDFVKGTNSLSRLLTPAFAGVFVFFLIAGSFFAVPSAAQALTVNPRIELNADPGTTLRTILRITNDERQSRIFYLRFENFNSQDETGNPSFTTRQEGLATWIKTQDSITLGPGETVDMPVDIAIPIDAEPGGHFAAIFFLATPPEVEEDLGRLGIAAKLGTLVLLRVNGDFVQNAIILEFNTKDKKKIFTQLPVQFYYRFQNTGDDHQRPIGDIQISNIFGQITKLLAANTIDGSVLPKSIRRFTSVWTEAGGDLKQPPVIDVEEAPPLPYWQTAKEQWHHFIFGRYTANLKVVYGTKELKSDNAELVFYIIPWQLLSIMVPSGIVLLILLRFGVKRYNRYIISRARKAN